MISLTSKPLFLWHNSQLRLPEITLKPLWRDMRSEQEMYQLIINTAQKDERIRAVILNGSRANPNAPRDCFQDFDIVYIVTDVAPYRHNLEWIRQFGEIMILQLPDDMQNPPATDKDRYTFLAQFMDGNRIDLTLFPIVKLGTLEEDSQSVLLLDKDGIIAPFPPPSDHGTLPKPPTARAFFNCCNEFWWVCPYVAKGLWREEILYAKSMQERTLRPQLMKMLTWTVGVETQFACNPGKLCKYLKHYLEPELWIMLEKTYADASYEHTWEALYTMCDLFRAAALRVAEHFDFEYPFSDDERVSAHLRHVQLLPRDATEIY